MEDILLAANSRYGCPSAEMLIRHHGDGVVAQVRIRVITCF
jgi:hypothetical protein